MTLPNAVTPAWLDRLRPSIFDRILPGRLGRSHLDFLEAKDMGLCCPESRLAVSTNQADPTILRINAAEA